MRFAVLGDVHGNVYALRSVIEDINNRNVDFILSTGDLVGYMPFPNEVVDLIRRTGILSVQGNHDKYISSCKHLSNDQIAKMSQQEILANASAAYTNMVLTEENRNYLRSMPSQVRIQVDGLNVLVVHGSPRRIDEYMYEDSPALKEIAETTDADIIISGHTHIPFTTVLKGKHIINAGSAGKPKHGRPDATYVIVDVKDNKVISEIIETPYEVEKIINAIESNNMFDKRLIDMLSKGY
ncbi:metallophosphoesterase family protein [Pseudobacteroides cellulosolvens]|uniref:Phosphoesterase n=1 Tax=Pseudobacteroides cellulosolvens ATCC 35603 = DSM 2933 TaxID=398512 RepID=A0A0L6JQH1_9FIRM|nr:YfcE family phosphodiesterase [Pseudobacteroides cellulosolvens]KNY27612.1 phosphodiesterase, MJ0936 family [Pseudobacteroides cellulosolvens ATCC 35603 = DSM 2933]